jgi:prevent-host-death family protein
MDAQWQLQDAKQRFSELIRAVLADGPQVVTRHGEEVAVVIDVAEYHRLRAGQDLPEEDFKDFLRSAPDLEEVVALRSRDTGRFVEFDPAP